jgi:hypothetical protein
MRATLVCFLLLSCLPPLWAEQKAADQPNPTGSTATGSQGKEQTGDQNKHQKKEEEKPLINTDDPGGPPQYSATEAVSLPPTASPLPLVGSMGLILVATALLLMAKRRWISKAPRGSEPDTRL